MSSFHKASNTSLCLKNSHKMNIHQMKENLTKKDENINLCKYKFYLILKFKITQFSSSCLDLRILGLLILKSSKEFKIFPNSTPCL